MEVVREVEFETKYSKKAKNRKKIKANQVDSKSYLWFKRCIDIVGASMGLFILLPLFLVIAILIKIEDSQGAVFFKQTRIGKNEIPFSMFKFRSMVTDAEEQFEKLLTRNEAQGAMFKIKEDPRITKVGRFIRRTSIDELPQLLNVLRGDMSLVGPRPPLPREVEQYTSYDKQRLIVTPGCTGLWQVSGRNSLGFTEMVELDLEYISNISFKNDIKIIFKTFSALVGDDNAY